MCSVRSIILNDVLFFDAAKVQTFYRIRKGRFPSHCNLRFYVGMGVIAIESEIIKPEFEDVPDLRIEIHAREGPRGAGELEACLFDVVGIQVNITKCMHERSGLQVADLSHHHCQQGIGSDVKGDSEKYIGRALIELTIELSVSHIKLEQGVTWGERHLVEFTNIPGIDDDATRMGLLSDEGNGPLNLIDYLTVRTCPGAPLLAIDRTQITVLISPFIPYSHPILLKIFHIGVAS